MKPEEFWASSLREFDYLIQADTKKKQYEAQMYMWHAWNTALFSRQKKLPNLKKVLADLRQTPKKPKTPEALYEMAKAITERLGGTVKSLNP